MCLDLPRLKMDDSTAKTINILVVDDDTTCLAVVAAVLRKSKYQVATVKHPIEALVTLRIKGGFDLVVSDVHMPEMSGFQLQQYITREFHLPVVLMSADDKDSLVAKGAETGAALFISKPVSVNDVRDLWRIADSRKKKNCNRITAEEMTPESGSDGEGASVIQAAPATCMENPNKKSERKDGKFKTEKITRKKKLVWTASLHSRFLEAIRKLGLKNAVPKKILDAMDVPGLTRENVASHLQKYRIFLRRVSDVTSTIQAVDGRFAGRASLRPRIAARRLNKVSLVNEESSQAVQPSVSRNITVEQPMCLGGFSSYLFSNHLQASPPKALSGYGQSSLLSVQRNNPGRQSPPITSNFVNPIYQRNFTTLSPLVANGNGAITSLPAVQGGGGGLLPQTSAAADETKNEMLMGALSDHRISGRVAVPKHFDHDILSDDDVFNFLGNQTQSEGDVSPKSRSSNSSNPSSTVTEGGNPFSPLFVDTMDQQQTLMPPSHPVNGIENTGGESSSLLTPVSNFSMFDPFFADQPSDGGWGDLSSKENENITNSNFISALNQTKSDQYLPGIDRFLVQRDDEDLLESVFASIPFGGAENRQEI